MKINKTLNSFANESLEKYNNQNFLAELLQKIQPSIVENNSLKFNKLVISTFSVALVLALSIPIIVNSSQAKNPMVPINSTVPKPDQGRNLYWFVPRDISPALRFPSQSMESCPEIAVP